MSVNSTLVISGTSLTNATWVVIPKDGVYTVQNHVQAELQNTGAAVTMGGNGGVGMATAILRISPEVPDPFIGMDNPIIGDGAAASFDVDSQIQVSFKAGDIILPFVAMQVSGSASLSAVPDAIKVFAAGTFFSVDFFAC